MGEGISIYFTESKFENAILRHGQYVRWYNSVPCFCADTHSPDPNCKVCLGRGRIFYPTKQHRKLEEYFSHGGTKIIVTGTIKSINRVYSANGTIYTVSSFSGNDIFLTTSLTKGQYIWVDYVEEKEGTYSGSATYVGNNIIQIPLTPIVTAQGSFTGEISEVTSVTNVTTGLTLNVISYWEDLILVEGTINDGDSITTICEYVDPVIMLITSSEPKESKEKHGPIPMADASMSFSGLMDVGKGDLITPLTANSRTSFLGNYKGSGNYKTNFFKLSNIIKIIDAVGEIDDAVVIRDNEINFPSRAPNGKFSCSVNYRISYIVDDIPKIRHAENKILPKKVPLKRYLMGAKVEKRPKPINKFERM